MAKFTTYAEVLTAKSPLMQMHAAGVKKTLPGRPFGELLEETGGAYHIDLDMVPHMRERLQQLHELTGDKKLLAISKQRTVHVSFEHLRGTDPNARVSVGYRLMPEPGEPARLERMGPVDPRTTAIVDNDQ